MSLRSPSCYLVTGILSSVKITVSNGDVSTVEMILNTNNNNNYSIRIQKQ
jgi:hypothetical protein